MLFENSVYLGSISDVEQEKYIKTRHSGAIQRCLIDQYCVNCKDFTQENLRFSAEMQDGAFSLITLKHAEHNVFH